MNVGAAQIRISGSIPKNLAKIALYVEKARRKRLDLLVFPECSLTGYLPAMKAGPPYRQDVTHALREVLKMAKSASVAIVVGASWPERGRLYNRSIAVSRAGKPAATYDKIHLMDEDRNFYDPGRRLPVFRMSSVSFGMQICLDQRFPEGWRVLAAGGAKIVTHPVYMKTRSWGWKRPVIEAHLRSRAAENGIFVVSANVAFTPVNHASMIVGPDGTVISRATSGGERLVCAGIDPRLATHEMLNGRRADIFGPLA